jgi:hypothetical protein
MGRRSRLKTGICLAVMLLGVPVHAAAQLIVIRQGAFTIPHWLPPAYVDISGTRGFKFQGVAVGWGFTAMTQCGEGCPPGLIVELDAEAAGSNLNGTARLQGTTYPDIGSISTHESLVLRFTGQVMMPPMSDGPVTVTVPFDFAGQFSYETAGVPQPTVLLTGGGRATLFLEPSPDGASWIVTAAEFDFQSVRR